MHAAIPTILLVRALAKLALTLRSLARVWLLKGVRRAHGGCSDGFFGSNRQMIYKISVFIVYDRRLGLLLP